MTGPTIKLVGKGVTSEFWIKVVHRFYLNMFIVNVILNPLKPSSSIYTTCFNITKALNSAERMCFCVYCGSHSKQRPSS
jgi:hypothetical protein